MVCNAGKVDRIIRYTIGVVFITLAASGVLGPMAWFGVIPVLVGLSGWCPLYPLLGINTCKIGAKTNAAEKA